MSSYQLNWSVASPGCTPVSYSVSGGGTASTCTYSGCTVSGLSSNTTYTFSVTASNSAGSATGSVTITTPSLTVTAGAINGFGNTQVQWSASGFAAGTQFSPAASTGGSCGGSTSTTGSCTINVGTCWQNNTITVNAGTSNGFVGSGSGVAALNNTVPPAVTMSSNYSATQSSLTPAWTNVPSATYYQVRYRDATANGQTYSAGDFITNTSILISGLTSGHNYTIVVYSSSCYAKVSGGGTTSLYTTSSKSTN
jgi:hypothetical protein